MDTVENLEHMNDFLIKNNEIMIFTDFNRTLVDFENEYNFLYNRFDEDAYKKVFNLFDNTIFIYFIR